ncbi:MAG: TlpA family protein disulfide reductase [Candidatus Heimdallarchaeota archaeon]|nr:TlpA family protein disulfide reductase [Candidatus Heimdallarchaeota archaeon]
MRKVISILTITIFLTLPFSTNGYSLTGSYRNLQNADVEYANYEGSYLFLEAMDIDCGACQAQHGDLKELHTSHGSKMSMVSVSVNFIGTADTLDRISEFTAEHPTTWAIGMDTDNYIRTTFGVDSTPQMFLFNPDGNVIRKWVGQTSLERLQSDIDVLLAGGTLEDGITASNDGSDSSIIGRIFASPVFKMVFFIGIILMLYMRSLKPSDEAPKVETDPLEKHKSRTKSQE